MDTATVLGVGPLFLGWYVAIGLTVAVAVFVILVVQGVAMGESAGSIIWVALGGAALAVWLWPLAVKMYVDDNGSWRG